MKVVIEEDDCISCGTCMSLCGEVFEFGEENLSNIVEEYRGETPYQGTVPDDIACVELAVENCPTSCIKIVEE